MQTPITIIGAGPVQVTCVGAGPAGMTAALFAARAGAKVRLIDGNEQVGRKLLVTGSGRANLTNQKLAAGRYTCADLDWLQRVFATFGHTQTVDFLDSVGVPTFATHDGWCYPLSESAQTVVDAFANALRQAGVELVLNTKVKNIKIRKGGWPSAPSVETGFNLELTNGTTLQTEKLIVAAGGKAYPTLGSRGELFASLKNLGHTVHALLPALAPVTCDMTPWKKLSGVRFDAQVSLYEGSSLLADTTGNLIVTDWGLNGPAVMDLSHQISSRPNAKLELVLNPLFASETVLRGLIERSRESDTPLQVLAGAVLAPKLAQALIQRAGYQENTPIRNLKENQVEKLLRAFSALPFKVTGVRGFEYCQVSSGGVPVTEVDPLNMRSRLVPGLSLVGETLDVVGPCGGYNLQFAFSSGALAGMGLF